MGGLADDVATVLSSKKSTGASQKGGTRDIGVSANAVKKGIKSDLENDVKEKYGETPPDDVARALEVEIDFKRVVVA